MNNKCVCCGQDIADCVIGVMCIDCKDVLMSIGDNLTEEKKARVEKRRLENGYYEFGKNGFKGRERSIIK